MMFFAVFGAFSIFSFSFEAKLIMSRNVLEGRNSREGATRIGKTLKKTKPKLPHVKARKKLGKTPKNSKFCSASGINR